MKIILDDTKAKSALYPFTATRHAADIRIGILTIREKWAYFPELEIDYGLAGSSGAIPNAKNNLRVVYDAGIVPSKEWLGQLLSNDLKDEVEEALNKNNKIKILRYPWQVFQFNDWALRKDFEMITSGRTSEAISATNKIIGGNNNIFLEQGASVEHSILNASTGPVYIGKNAQVQEGCMIRGPFALCEGAILKMGSKIYGATTIGPYCTAAGEIKNSVIFGYSNKAHDGYLGDSVIGEWCNLGAGTTNSNVKNTAAEVKVWFNEAGSYVSAGQKCGLLMGDYSRAAINTSFNTGTVVGVCCNIFGAYFPPKFIPDFTWGDEKYTFDKAMQDIDNWKKFKGSAISGHEQNILKQIYIQ